MSHNHTDQRSQDGTGDSTSALRADLLGKPAIRLAAMVRVFAGGETRRAPPLDRVQP